MCCLHIADQKVLKEASQTYLLEARVLYRQGKTYGARVCVQQALIIGHCNGVDNET